VGRPALAGGPAWSVSRPCPVFPPGLAFRPRPVMG